MIFYVTMAVYLMTLLMNEFTSIVTPTYFTETMFSVFCNENIVMDG